MLFLIAIAVEVSTASYSFSNEPSFFLPGLPAQPQVPDQYSKDPKTKTQYIEAYQKILSSGELHEDSFLPNNFKDTQGNTHSLSVCNNNMPAGCLNGVTAAMTEITSYLNSLCGFNISNCDEAVNKKITNPKQLKNIRECIAAWIQGYQEIGNAFCHNSNNHCGGYGKVNQPAVATIHYKLSCAAAGLEEAFPSCKKDSLSKSFEAQEKQKTDLSPLTSSPSSTVNTHSAVTQ